MAFGARMAKDRYRSWGRLPQVAPRAVRMNWRHQQLPGNDSSDHTLLPFGNGRSYGDSCLNSDGCLVDVRGLNHFIDFDRERGVIRCEAGMLLAEILALIVPAGWFLPCVPGTELVTVGGAIANDVHGKNHHRVGSFGAHLRAFELLRSDQRRVLCAHDHNTDWFRATIGGLGLTGVVTWAELGLKRIESPLMLTEERKFADLSEFFELTTQSDTSYEYTVAWLDCLAPKARGVFMRANHGLSTEALAAPSTRAWVTLPNIPVTPLCRLAAKTFNALYYHKPRPLTERVVHYRSFFFPLDKINQWNRIYGPRGLLQYQCVVPIDQGRAVVQTILDATRQSGFTVFLAVLKIFGKHPSAGMLSFARPGITLTMDFRHQGEPLLAWLEGLDEIIRAAGGVLYPAKDARITKASFAAFFPQWEKFAPFIDPRFSSDFWRRVSN